MMILRDDIVITQQLAYIHKVIYTRNNEQLMVGVTEGYVTINNGSMIRDLGAYHVCVDY